jgi:hypothetical protein
MSSFSADGSLIELADLSIEHARDLSTSPSIISRPYVQIDSIASPIIFDGNELSAILF